MSLTNGKALVRHDAPEARACAHPGCATRLSRYNPDPSCGAHGGWLDPDARRGTSNSAPAR